MRRLVRVLDRGWESNGARVVKTVEREIELIQYILSSADDCCFFSVLLMR